MSLLTSAKFTTGFVNIGQRVIVFVVGALLPKLSMMLKVSGELLTAVV